MPLLKGNAEHEDFRDRALFWHFPAYLQSYARIDGQRDILFRSRPVTVMRQGKWKLHEYFEDAALELYDLEADPGESTNLAAKEKQVLERLHNTMKQWRADIQAPVPSELNQEYDPEAEANALSGKRLRRKSR